MIGDLLLGLIVVCMTILVGYPLFNLVSVSLKERSVRRRTAQR